MNPFAKLVAARLARRQHEVDTHPDTDMLAAFSERSLRNTERQAVVAHLERCEQCREVVALSSPDGAEVRQKSGSFGWLELRWAAALAGACMVLLLVWRSETPQQRVPKMIERPAIVLAVEQTIAVERPAPASKKNQARMAVKPRNPAPLLAREQPMALLQQEALPPLGTAAGAVTPSARTLRLQEAFAPILRQQSVWSLGVNAGTLWRSDDGGRTRSAVAVDGRTNLLALSAWGADVWVGGDGGALFHSTDNGSHWVKIGVHAGDERLTEPIIGLEVNPPQFVTLTTRRGDWISTDGGVSWRKE